MNPTFRFCALFTGVLTAAALSLSPNAPAQTPVADNSGFEILTRGPVHEAFAQPGDLPLQPGTPVPKQPPGPIPEVPPDIRPDGANVQWLGGYWAWDADRNEFEWISGAYRDVPPGRKYVAGYWEQAPEGWRWVAGFWAPDAQQELPYVPQPPASLEIGPTLPPPGDNYFYAPGTWLYQSNRYVWQPGYYAACQPDLVWTPPHYAWTPGGCLFVTGYWDYPLERRGLLFAPVFFSRPLWASPGWAWRPHYVVGFGAMFDSFFVDVRFGHYRFGDYYGTAYVNRGIHPWHVWGPGRHDPLYGYYRWQNRGNPSWQTGMAKAYDNRLAGRQPLPPRTLAQQTQISKQGNITNLQMVQPLAQFNDKNVRLSKVSGSVVTQQQTAAKRIQDAAQTRFKTESALAKGPALAAGKAAPPRTLNLTDASKGIAAKDLKTPAAISKSPPAPITQNKGIPDAKSLPSVSKGPATINQNKGIQDAKSLPSVSKGPATINQNKAIQDAKSLPSVSKGPATINQNKAIQDAKSLPSISKGPVITQQNKAIQEAKSLPAIKSAPLPSIAKQAAPQPSMQLKSSPALRTPAPVTRAASQPTPRPAVQASRPAPRPAVAAHTPARGGNSNARKK
ncbi:MAG TPA: hypothetical protein VE988_08595 [Gemmataceae bacterium]|nr:hypothetical protein [Gemmataceae bacterium]